MPEFTTAIDVNTVDTNKSLSGDLQPLPNGWYKIVLIGEGEEKTNAAGDRQTQRVDFRVIAGDYANRNISMWFTTRVANAKDAWSVEQTQLFFTRIAKCCNIKTLKSTNQIRDIAFYAYLTQRESTRKTPFINDETGDITYAEKKSVFITVQGNANDTILSVNEYEGSDRKFIKKAKTQNADDFGKIEAGEEIPF